MELNDEMPKKLAKKMAARFSILRKDAGMTQADLAETLGFTQNVVFRAENTMNMSVMSLFTLYLYYLTKRNVNPMWLFAYDNENVSRYLTDDDKSRLKRQNMDNKRKQVMDEMLASLRNAGLIGEESEE